MEENVVQDLIETHIRTKYIGDCRYMIEIRLRKKCVNFIDDVRI